MKIKNKFLQNHMANFNQTWHKVPLVERDLILFKYRATPFPKAEIITKSRKYIDEILKSSSQEPPGNFNQTWHKASLCEEDSSLFKWSAMPFSKERLLWNREYTFMKFKNILQNHRAIFNQTWHKASLGDEDIKFLHIRTIQSS